jgi:hypothetical protein
MFLVLAYVPMMIGLAMVAGLLKANRRRRHRRLWTRAAVGTMMNCDCPAGTGTQRRFLSCTRTRLAVASHVVMLKKGGLVITSLSRTAREAAKR